MKVTDLMLGDLVWIKPGRIPIGRYGKVCQLCKTMIWANPLDDGEQAIDAYIDLFEPIELTNEMLLLNGFSKSSECDWFWMAGFPFDISKDKYNTNPDAYELRTSSGVYGKIQHVHELQNLLRSFGMVELADNFKLK